MKNRKSPYDHQLRLEAALQPGETPEEHVGRLHGMIARGHSGAAAELRRLEGSFTYQMYLKSKPPKRTLQVVS